MQDAIQIEPLRALGPAVKPLVLEAERNGFGFMRRLAAEWASGANRFNRPGECLLAAYHGCRLVGVGGLNRDPYASSDGIGRLRHLYVLAAARRLGVGSRLVARILDDAHSMFQVVRLRANTEQAAAFYVRLGFTSTNEEAASHIMVLNRGGGASGEDGSAEAARLGAQSSSVTSTGTWSEG